MRLWKPVHNMMEIWHLTLVHVFISRTITFPSLQNRWMEKHLQALSLTCTNQTCSLTTPLPLLAYPAFGAIVGWNFRPSTGKAVAAALPSIPQRDLCRRAQIVGNVVAIWVLDYSVCWHVTVGWLLQDGAVAKRGVQLERTVQLCWCPPILYSLNNSPHCSSSACPSRRLHLISASVLLFPWITAGPAPLAVNIWLAKGGTQVKSEICVIILHLRVWITEGAISSKQEADVVVSIEQFLVGVGGGFWLTVRVYVLWVSSGAPWTARWAVLLVCLSDNRLRLWLVWFCGPCVQWGGVTEQLKSGIEGLLLDTY